MVDYRHFNEETAEDRQQRRDRAKALTGGKRGADGLTAAEYALLTYLSRIGLEVALGYLVNNRSGQGWPHTRIVGKAS